MKVLVTAGGTSVPIDPVRRITNSATGRLGSLVADEFARRGAEVVYLAEKGTRLPQASGVEVVEASDLTDVARHLETILTGTTIDVVVHSMAVVDYAVARTATRSALARHVAEGLLSDGGADAWRAADATALTGRIDELLSDPAAALAVTGKLSSHIPDLVVFMQRTPKLIEQIKHLQPSTVLVGFKLLDHVPRQTLLDAAHSLMEQAGCDLVLANDLSTIDGDRHEGLLVDGSTRYSVWETKQDIARGIADRVDDLIAEPTGGER